MEWYKKNIKMDEIKETITIKKNNEKNSNKYKT